MNNNLLIVIVLTALIAAAGAVAAASVIAPATAPVGATSGLSKAQVNDLIREATDAVKADYEKAIAERVPVSDSGAVPKPAAAAAGDKDAKIAELESALEATKAHLKALQTQFDDYVATEARRQRQGLQDLAEGGIRQGMNQLMERAPEFIDGITNRMGQGLTEQLQLDDAQREAFTGRMKSNFESMIDTMRKAQAGEITQEEARARMEQMQKETEEEMKSTLTEEQYQKFQEMGGQNFWRQGFGRQGGGQGGAGNNPFGRQGGNNGRGRNRMPNGGGNGQGEGF